MNRKIVLIICLMMSGLLVFSQGYHFIYLQTANKSPFFVKINGEVLSSTETGYLIVSQIVDEEVEFSIGFIQKQWPEQQYRIKMSDHDRGLLIQFGETGFWNLSDLQTSQSISTADKMQVTSGADEFSRVLAEVSNDPTLFQTNAQGKKVEVIQKIELAYSLLDGGYRKMIYLIKNIADGKLIKTDSIQVDLDYRSPEAQTKTEQVVIDTTATFIKELIAQTDSIKIQKDTVSKNMQPNAPKVFMACKQEADEKDFVLLRKKMAGADTELDMLDLASKAFKKKCYQTEQIRNLCSLMLQDDNRYRFFEMAYPATSDKNNFVLLQTLITGQQNIERFKNLIR